MVTKKLTLLRFSIKSNTTRKLLVKASEDRPSYAFKKNKYNKKTISKSFGGQALLRF